MQGVLAGVTRALVAARDRARLWAWGAGAVRLLHGAEHPQLQRLHAPAGLRRDEPRLCRPARGYLQHGALLTALQLVSLASIVVAQ